MDITFEVGERYQNRNGEYDVIELDGSRMVIQYLETGERFDADREIQERIWCNICNEERAEQEKNTRKAGKGKKNQGSGRGASKGSGFQGLVEADFQEGTKGTSWRNRGSLGGLLARHLTDRGSVFYESYAVPRQPMVHIARPDHYGHEAGQREVKFFLKLDSTQATYGLHVERGSDSAGDSQAWPRLLRNLRGNAGLRGQVEDFMNRLGLQWYWCVWEDESLLAKVFWEEGGWSWDALKGADREALSWEEFLDRLEGLDEKKGCGLHLYGSMAKEEALNLGLQVVDSITDDLVALAPLYSAAVEENM